jgi:ubiquitin-conjugating enzyme E2 variant
MEALFIAAQIAGIYLLADWITGAVHFWMDRYGKPDMPIVGPTVVEINTMHHANPYRMTQRSYWYLTKYSYVLVGILALVIYLVSGSLSWQWILGLLLGANANIIHKWSHLTAQERPIWVHVLQRLRLIQSPKEHQRHHGHVDHLTAYCVMTDFLNPVLERIRFWQAIETATTWVGLPPNDRLLDH